MAATPSALYSSAVAQLSDPAGTDWSADTIKIALVTSSYAFSAAHDFFDDITNELSHASYTAGGATLASKTEVASGGVRTYDAADPVFASLAAAAGTPAAAIVYRDTGTAATSPLLAYLRLPETAPDGTDYTVVLPSDGVIRLTPTTLRWVDLGPMLASHANSADYDPNSVFSSLTVSGNDITVAIDNSVSVDGTSEGAVIVVGDPATLVPGWVSDGSCWLAVHITVSANPPDSKQYWIAAGLAANTSTYPGNASGLKRTTTANIAAVFWASADSLATGNVETYWRGLIAPGSDGSALRSAFTVSTLNNAAANAAGTITSGQLRLCVFAGCETSANDGPHSATVRIRVAAVPVVPA